MMRRGILVFLPCGLLGLLAQGCVAPAAPSRVARVELPQGLEKPKGLKPDPKSQAAPVSPSNTEAVAVPAAQVRPNGQDPSVAGVCYYGEATVDCWNVVGERDKRLTGVVKGLLRARHDSIPTTFGKRNRIVVVDLPNPSGNSSYRVITGAPSGSGETTISRASGRQLVFVAEDEHAPKTTIRFVQGRRLSKTVSLAVKKGATAELGGCTLTVGSVAKLEPRNDMAFLLRGGPGWRVVVRRTGGGSHPPAFLPIDLYPMLMTDGRRARFIGKVGKLEYAPKDVPRVLPYGDSRLPKDVFAVLIDRDPVKSAPLLVGADQERSFTLSDIPLDPR